MGYVIPLVCCGSALGSPPSWIYPEYLLKEVTGRLTFFFFFPWMAVVAIHKDILDKGHPVVYSSVSLVGECSACQQHCLKNTILLLNLSLSEIKEGSAGRYNTALKSCECVQKKHNHLYDHTKYNTRPIKCLNNFTWLLILSLYCT